MATVRSRIAKGRSFQKRTMEKIKECFSFDEDDIRTCVGAETGEDIKLSKKAREILGVSIECKNMKNMNIWSALDQAKKNALKGCDEAVVFKRGDLGANKTYICLPFDSYLRLRKRLLELEDN